MFDGISAKHIGDRPVIEIPRPQPVLDRDGNPILRKEKPQFNVKADRDEFMISKQSPVRMAFSERFIIKPQHRAKPVELAIFFYLANTTEWSRVEILIDGDKKPLLTSGGKGQAVITTYGNRSATRTVQEIVDAVGVSKGAAYKALDFWESASVVKRIREYVRKDKASEISSGRPPDHRRYEFDPEYVWNGYIWIGTGYSDYLQGPIEVVG